MLAVLLVGLAMASLDSSIVNVAAPTMRRDLHLSGALLQLVVSGYLLAYAALLITGARLGDDHGHRRLFLGGLAGFTGASLACGLAPVPAVLVAARLGQGVSAALLVPQVLAVVQLRFQGRERARALGLYALVLAVGVALGQVLGGVLVSADLLGAGWRPIFLVNVPIELGLLLAARAVLPVTAVATSRPPDLVGIGILSLSMILLVVPLTFGREAGWPLWTWLSLAAALALLPAFLAIERRVARDGGAPLVDPALLLTPGVPASLLVVAVLMGGYAAFIFSLTLHLQGGLGLDALHSGLSFSPYALGFAAASLSWSRLAPRALRLVPVCGLLVLAGADLTLGLIVRSAWTPALALPLLVLAGAGHGAGFGPLVQQVVARIPPRHAAAIGGLISTVSQLAGAIGVATLGSVYLATAHPGSAQLSARGFSLVSFAIVALSLAAVPAAVRIANARACPSEARD
jgi:MFS family permease